MKLSLSLSLFHRLSLPDCLSLQLSLVLLLCPSPVPPPLSLSGRRGRRCWERYCSCRCRRRSICCCSSASSGLLATWEEKKISFVLCFFFFFFFTCVPPYSYGELPLHSTVAGNSKYFRKYHVLYHFWLFFFVCVCASLRSYATVNFYLLYFDLLKIRSSTVLGAACSSSSFRHTVHSLPCLPNQYH